MLDALVVLAYVVAPLLLGVLIGYGVFQWRHRRLNRQTEAARDQATKELYRGPDD